MLAWFLIPLLLGCGRPAPAPTVGSTAAAAPSSPAPSLADTPPRVRATLVPLEAFGAYRVELGWTALPGQSEFWVERRRGLEKRIIAQVENAFSVSDAEVGAGQVYAYSVLAREGEGNCELGTAEIAIPTDRSLGAGEHLGVPKDRYGRLRLEKGAILRIGESDLEWDLIALISDGGRIETWPVGSVGSADGARGGRIRIRVREARGTIDLHSLGQAGAAGTPGTEGQPGAPGMAGQVARYAFDNGGYLLATNRLRGIDPRDFWKVEVPAVPPGPGADGSPGGNGQDGWRGGDAGGVSLEVEAPGPFLPNLVSEGGAGGAGGMAGAGGPGGASGLWMGNDGGLPPAYRPNYVPPASGKRGASGRNGNPGAPGSAGPLCFRVAGKAVLGCD